MTTRSDEVRTEVAKAYGERVSQPAPESAPESAARISARISAGTGGLWLRRRAGAEGRDSSTSPATPPTSLRRCRPTAVVNSFGCGNPVALAGLRAGDVVLDLGSGAGIDLLLAAKDRGAGGPA